MSDLVLLYVLELQVFPLMQRFPTFSVFLVYTCRPSWAVSAPQHQEEKSEGQIFILQDSRKKKFQN